MDRDYQRENNLKWHLMKHPMTSSFGQGWGMPSGTTWMGSAAYGTDGEDTKDAVQHLCRAEALLPHVLAAWP